MPASSTSSYSSRSSNKSTSVRSQADPSRDQQLLLRAERDFDETSSVASSRTSQSSTSIISRYSYGSQMTKGNPASLATSYVSLRELELRKSQIENELARVQHELQLRESQHAAAQLPSTTSKARNK